MNKIIFEVIASSIQDALNAKNGGADRIELLTSIHLGGLSATPSMVKLVKKKCDINIAAMVRPRGGGFFYTELEKELMFLEAEDLIKSGADGIVFGFLNEDASIDEENTKKMIDLIHSYKKEAVFHRAIDCTKNYESSIELLINLGIDRILTSGQKDKVIDALDLIKSIQEKYENKVQILVGSGITDENVKQIIDSTNVKQIHSSCKTYNYDCTSNSNSNLTFDYNEKNGFEANDTDKIKAISNILKNY